MEHAGLEQGESNVDLIAYKKRKKKLNQDYTRANLPNVTPPLHTLVAYKKKTDP